MARRHNPRRGVVLLIVIMLLTLLIVIGLTFAVMSGQFRRGAESAARRERYGMPPDKLLDRAMYQLVRDTPNTSRSALKGHSLLRDLVGDDGVAGTVGVLRPVAPSSVPALPDGEFLTFTVADVTSAFSKKGGHYNGCTLTFLGPGINPSVVAESTRIVSYSYIDDPLSPQIYITIEWSAGEGGIEFYPQQNVTRFRINGRPFNGTGAGYQLATQSLDQKKLDDPLQPETALLPNYGMYVDLPSAPNPTLGGLDEPWDAVDFQNMFLAMNPPNPRDPGIIPSFHRPELVNYWLKRFTDTELSGLLPDQRRLAFQNPLDPSIPIDANTRQRLLNLKRNIILRPLPEDHPNFPNPAAFKDTMGSPSLSEMIWDVDNDGDGIADSVWLDIGMPVQTDASGRCYKPLVAILCQDMDGRLNANAHSNYSHNDPWYANSASAPVALQVTPAQTDPNFPSLLPFAGGPSQRQLLPRGLGFGPADIFLGHVFHSEFANLLTQRYRHVSVPPSTWGGGESNVDDPMSLIKSMGTPMLWSATRSAYGTPPDLMGISGIGLDFTGQPLAFYLGRNGQTVGDPYEMVLNRASAGNYDATFTVAELERILRYDDVDAYSLPNRLLTCAPTALFIDTIDARKNRRSITTHSSHLPVASGMLPEKWRASGVPGKFNVLDAYQEKLAANIPSPTADKIRTEMLKIVPWEMWHGERMNLNRWLGNGLDDDSNFVADEPGEPCPRIWPDTTDFHPGNAGAPPVEARPVPETFRNVPFDFRNDDPFPENAWSARQIYARHLYCLMMLLSDGFVHPVDNETPPLTPSPKLTAHRIAQWAINVVDYRDSDAIMTPFIYDENPWDGWNSVDGVVWGSEYPELLLTEATAFHDVRVRDTKEDTSRKKYSDDPKDGPDQYRIPQGSLFLEFYCPHNRPNNLRYGDSFAPDPSFPAELYDPDGSLDLARRIAPDALPVWRVAIGEQHVDAETAESPLEVRRTKPETTTFNPDQMSLITQTDRVNIERYIWFADVPPETVRPVLPAADQQKIFWNRSGDSSAKVPPASYLVVGPRQETSIGSRIQSTPPADYLPSLQRVTLLPGGIGIQFSSSDGTVPEPYEPTSPAFSKVKPARTMVAAANPPLDLSADPPTPAWEPSNYAKTLRLAPTGPLASQYGVGLNVTEPLPTADSDPATDDYYREPDTQLKSNVSECPYDSYYDYDDPTKTSGFPDEPFDVKNAQLSSFSSVQALEDGTPIQEFAVECKPNYRTAFLQRLANPLLRWDPNTNPYITVDWIPIDVTVFNGEDEVDDSALAFFESRERNGRERSDPNNPISPRNLWSQETDEPSDKFSSTSSGEYFKFELSHSLGYLNRPYGPTLGVPAVPPTYAGDPAQGPFPWLAWNNRPFANPLELMQVPTSMPSRLLHEFGMLQTTVDSPYDSSDSGNWQRFRGHFPHLLNFFHSSSENTAGADFYRLFDYVETPSPFVGAEKWYNPQTLGSSNFFFHAPYNHMSRFQDPGRVNINTIFDTENDYPIWEGLAKGFPAMDPTLPGGRAMFNRIMLSRRGSPASTSFYELDSTKPTLFGNPFRPADSADLMPLPELRKNQPVQATLLREDLLNNRKDALFVPFPENTAPVQDQQRNPYFRYQGLARLSNLVSNNSNVFAVWITLGYFDVEPNPTGIDQAHPDGLRLGTELGTDSGQIRRHRAFYIIDRSVPVAFEPGENHNVDRAVLLRRFIE